MSKSDRLDEILELFELLNGNQKSFLLRLKEANKRNAELTDRVEKLEEQLRSLT